MLNLARTSYGNSTAIVMLLGPSVKKKKQTLHFSNISSNHIKIADFKGYFWKVQYEFRKNEYRRAL